MYKKVIKFSFKRQKLFWVLVFSFMYLVLVDVMDRSYVTNNCFFLSEFELHLYTSLWPISKDNFFKKNLNSQTRLINGFYLTYKIESKGTCGLFEGQPASEHLSSHLSQNISIELIDSVFVAYCSAGVPLCGPFLVKFWDSVIFSTFIVMMY